MVSSALRSDFSPYAPTLELLTFSEAEVEQITDVIRHTTIQFSELDKTEIRLDAASNIEAPADSYGAVASLRDSGLQLISLYGREGLCQKAFYPSWFKTVFVNSRNGIPFLSNSEITSLQPKIDNFLSQEHTQNLETLFLQKWDILISRSGTIGDVGLATEAF